MTVEVVVPEMGESVLEATVATWFKKEGEYVNAGEALVELETDKVNLEVGAKSAGVLAKINAQQGEDVKVGDLLATIDEAAEAPEEPAASAAQEPAPEAEPQESAAEAAPPGEVVPSAEGERQPGDGREGERQPTPQVTPVAMRLAREKGLDVRQIQGTGPDNRVTRADVEGFLQKSEKAEQTPEKTEVAPEAPADRSSRPEERLRMSRRRRTIARRLLEAQQTTAMLTTFNDIDMRAVMDLRRRRNEEFQSRHGLKLGIVSFFVKAAISALRAFPRLNAEIQGDEIVLKRYYDMGIAIGDEDGLVVPVLRDAQQLSFAEIERQINDLVTRTREGKLSIEDLRGGTFTITNGGIFGSLLSTPILNPPQVGILGLHRIEDRPIALDGEVVIRPMMYVALSYDHRIVDGREAVQFLVHIKDLLEDPERLLLEG